MGLSDAAHVLRQFVVARRHRTSIRSVDPGMALDKNLSRPMDEGRYEDLCRLAKGVPEFTLRMLEIWHCEAKGATWTVDVVNIRGELHNIPKKQVPVRYKLAEAAEKAGLSLSHKEAMALYREAQSVVTDALVDRAGRRLHGVVPSHDEQAERLPEALLSGLRGGLRGNG